MPSLSAELGELVRQRADNRCEYCRLSQERQEATFHVDHIWPRAAGGPTQPDNLALACVSCSLRKGARQTAVDPLTAQSVMLFHPRRERWSDHFELRGVLIVGHTPCGRATAEVLSLNRPLAVAIRREELGRGWRP